MAALSGAGLTVVNGLDGSSGTIEVTGTLSAINAALSAGLTYTYAPGTTSNTLTVSVDDGSGDTAFRTLSINTATPSAPTFTTPAVNGQINNGGTIDVTGTTTLDSTLLFNNGATVKVEAGGHLTLDDARISGGTVTNLGTVEIAGLGSISSGASMTNAGTLTIDSNAALIFSSTTITGGTINDGTIANTGGPTGGTIEVLGAATITGGATLNDGVVTVSDNVTLTLNGVTINASTINDGTVANTGVATGGSIAVTGSSKLDQGTAINNGAVAVSAATTLTLDDVTVTGTTITDANATTSVLQIDAGQTLTLSGVTINDGTINDGTVANTGEPDRRHHRGHRQQHDRQRRDPDRRRGLCLGRNDTDARRRHGDGHHVHRHGERGDHLDPDPTDTLTLSGVTINGGTINDGTGSTLATAATITIAGSSTIKEQCGAQQRRRDDQCR